MRIESQARRFILSRSLFKLRSSKKYRSGSINIIRTRRRKKLSFRINTYKAIFK
jgi:hypothetical protein